MLAPNIREPWTCPDRPPIPTSSAPGMATFTIPLPRSSSIRRTHRRTGNTACASKRWGRRMPANGAKSPRPPSSGRSISCARRTTTRSPWPSPWKAGTPEPAICSSPSTRPGSSMRSIFPRLLSTRPPGKSSPERRPDSRKLGSIGAGRRRTTTPSTRWIIPEWPKGASRPGR